MGWAAEEFAGAELGDARLSKRLVKLAEDFARQPSASIPAACRGWKETKAAYRLIGKEKLGWEEVMAPHWKCTHQRMALQPVVLCIQDTMELDFHNQQIAGLGRLSYEAQRGMYLHPTYAVTPDREPLGVTDLWMWARSPKGSPEDLAAPLESVRWLEGYERVGEQALELPNTRLVYVADREGDCLALIRRAAELKHPADWLMRSQHNRKLPRESLPKGQKKRTVSTCSEDPEVIKANSKLWSRTTLGVSLGELVFTTPRRPKQPPRQVHQTIWAERITLAPGLEVTCIVARELHPPAGVQALEWRLLTNRIARDLDAACELIRWYLARWEIEMLFNVVKNACKVEMLQLSTMGRLEKALAL